MVDSHIWDKTFLWRVERGVRNLVLSNFEGYFDLLPVHTFFTFGDISEIFLLWKIFWPSPVHIFFTFGDIWEIFTLNDILIYPQFTSFLLLETFERFFFLLEIFEIFLLWKKLWFSSVRVFFFNLEAISTFVDIWEIFWSIVSARLFLLSEIIFTLGDIWENFFLFWEIFFFKLLEIFERFFTLKDILIIVSAYFFYFESYFHLWRYFQTFICLKIR